MPPITSLSTELARCQRCEPLTHLFALRALEPLLRGARESLLEGAQEIFVSEGFRQIIDCAGFHRLYTSRHAGAARDENDLLPEPFFHQRLLKLEAI
jgi:hypothetical protein